MAWKGSIKVIVVAPVNALSELYKEVMQGPKSLKSGLVIVFMTPAFRLSHVLPIVYSREEGVSDDEVPGAVVRQQDHCSHIIPVHGRAGSHAVASMNCENE
jgi:hypothetical protein